MRTSGSSPPRTNWLEETPEGIMVRGVGPAAAGHRHMEARTQLRNPAHVKLL